MNGGGGYAFPAAWSSGSGSGSGSAQQQRQPVNHFPAAPPCRSRTIASPAAARASWTVPDLLYDHSSLLDCTRCINQGQSLRHGEEGHAQGTINILDREVMLQDMQLGVEDEDDMCLGMEMKIMRKRKLTSEQARHLEASFEADNKLEAEKKQRLADQLGLQPRQVAVWFQNRRARSKTKQLEIDFLTLKTDYERVLAQRRNLQAEVARLTAQLQAKYSKTQNNSCSQDSPSSTNSNNEDVVSKSTTIQTKKMLVQDPARDGEVLTSTSFGHNLQKCKDGIGNPQQEDSKSPNLKSYDWEPYDNGLWVFE